MGTKLQVRNRAGFLACGVSECLPGRSPCVVLGVLRPNPKSGLAAARARGRKLGRQVGGRPKSDKRYPKVIEAIEAGRSYRWIARDLGISKNTVTEIIRRHREPAKNIISPLPGVAPFREALIYSVFRPGSALEASIYQGATTGFLNKSASP